MARGRNDYETAQIQGRLWTPAVVPLKLWLDANDPATVVADSNGVSTWKDKTGLLSDFTQATNANKPTLVRHAASGGLQAISFDGTNDFLESSTGITSGTFSGKLTLVYAATRTNASQVATLFNERIAADYKAFEWSYGPNYIGYGGERISAYSNNTGVMNFHGNATYNKFTNTGAVVTQTYEGPTKKDSAWLNGSSFTSSINVYDLSQVPSIAGTAGSRVGGSNITQSNAVGFWPGSICEILAITDTLTFRLRVLMEGYLAWKWGYRLAADHPFANRPPLIGD